MSTKPFQRKLVIGGNEFVVDANIAIPPKSNRTRQKAQLIHKMSHGDSLQFKSSSQVHYFKKLVEKCGYKAETRKTGEKVWRVWVLKPEDK